jgi:heme/copper-type cytochrome/quinol oxidase subunit 2
MQSTAGRVVVGVIAVAIVVGLFIVLSGDDDGDSGTSTATTGKSDDESAITGKPAKKPKPKPEETATEIQVESGQPVGGVEKLTYTVDEPVRITVSSPDTTEHVHVHGYDVIADLAPGKPAKIDFDAGIEGVFEVELEGSATQIAELTVEP